jgi:hypothetical protein
MKILRISLLASGVLLAALAPVSSAWADVGTSNIVQVVSKNILGSPGNVVSGTVSCPAGMKMVSSGAGAGGNGVAGIAPVPGFNAAQASGVPLGTGYIQIDVGCLPASQLTETTFRSQLFPVGARRGVVSCPAGLHAFGGGGYFATPSGAMSLTAGQALSSNTVSADGTGWTVKGITPSATDRLFITTQCAPLRGSYVQGDNVPMVDVGGGLPTGQLYGSCRPGYMALSGGVYMTQTNGNEHDGILNWSIPAGPTSWFVSGNAIQTPGQGGARIVALEQCVPV